MISIIFPASNLAASQLTGNFSACQKTLFSYLHLGAVHISHPEMFKAALCF